MMYETINGLEVSALYYGRNVVAIFAKGHHDAEAFAAAATGYITTVVGGGLAADLGLPEEVTETDERIRLTWWRWVPAAPGEDHRITQYPAMEGDRGAFAVTVLALDPDYAVQS